MTATANSNDGTANLVNANDNSKVIPTLPNTVTIKNATKLTDNTWGVALPYGDWLASGYYNDEADYLSNDQSTLVNTVWTSMDYINSLLDDERGVASQTATGPATRHIYYGVRVDNPDKLLAGDYQIKVTYTATATIPTPILTKLILNDSVQQNQTSEFAIEGANLDTVSSIKLCPTGQQPDTTNTNCYEVPSEDIDTYLDDTTSSTKGTVLSFTNPAISEPGTYDLYTISPAGQTKLDQPFIVQEKSICRNGDLNSDCQVDIDDNMIPIAYDETNQQWNIVTDNDLTTQSSWYDYTNKQWANAVTLRDDYEAGAVCVRASDEPIDPEPDGPGTGGSGGWEDVFPIQNSAGESRITIENLIDMYSSDVSEDQLANFALSGSSIAVSNDGTCADTNLLSASVTRYTPLLWSRLISANNSEIELAGSDYTLDNPDIRNLFNKAILGYWVYIPRYAYEVQRPNAIDRVVTDEYPLPDNVNITGDDDSPYNKHSIRNEFSIHFETVTDIKKTPAETCNILNITSPDQMWANGTPTEEAGPDNTNILAKDYRTGCAAPGNTNNISRLYTDANEKGDNTTWATHPAFSWLDNDGNGEELNGLWIGKFETTGKVNAPTIKPNQHANVFENIGEFYTMARSIGTGTYDPTNNGGNTIFYGITQNSHNLNKATSHMLKNSEWGAITYLASSKYGAGTNNVSINSARPSKSADADIAYPSSDYRWGTTGCGPNNINRSTTAYSSVATSTGETVDLPALSSSHIEDPLACGDVDHSYIGNIGQLASTTNNVYGIYDMSGGASEYVMGNLTGYDDQSESSSTRYTENPIKPPYVDLYKESPYGNFTSGLYGSTNNPVAWSNTSYEFLWNNDICTWGTCGGHALHETKQYQSASGLVLSVSSLTQSWGDDYSYFLQSSSRWFRRGGIASDGSYAGLFRSESFEGGTGGYSGYRSVLLAAP